MFKGLEEMCPEIIVLMGNFLSKENNDVHPTEKLRHHFESLGHMIRQNDLACLRDQTQWIIMGSQQDAGICQIMPNLKFSEHLLENFKGHGPSRIKKVTVATNPMRMSYRGKEMVFCRYNYFKKIKRNHIERFEAQQETQREQERSSSSEEPKFDIPDTFRIAKTILHQGSLMPLAPIVQPIMWAYGDALHLYPHPDFLVLADECEDYHYHIPVNGHKTSYHDVSKLGNEDMNDELKTVTVINPGNFGLDRSFTVVYPLRNEVQPSKVPM